MTIRSAVRRTVYADTRLKTLFWVANNAKVALRSRLRDRAVSRSGSAHRARPVEDSLAYIEHVVEEYRHYGGVERFAGRACELGPGDNAGVAMLLRGDGVETVDLVDRYYSYRDPDVQAAIYAALAERHGLERLKRSSDWDEAALDGIDWYTDRTAEAHLARSADEGPRYDAILSRAVLEHVIDPLAVIESGVAALAPGGRMVHVVDLRDHYYYSREHPELTFLTNPGTVHRLMTRDCGGPNRVLVHRYRERLDALAARGLIAYRLLVSSLVDVGPVTPYRAYEDIDAPSRDRAERFVDGARDGFAREFAAVSTEDLAVSGFCLVVERSA